MFFCCDIKNLYLPLSYNLNEEKIDMKSTILLILLTLFFVFLSSCTKPNTPDNLETSDHPNNPGTSGTPNNPGTSGTPNNPGTSGTPDNPGTSGTLDHPNNPDNPGTSGTPNNPDIPNSNTSASDADVKDLYIAVDGTCMYKPFKDSEQDPTLVFDFHENYVVLGTSASDALNRYNNACRIQAFGAAGGDYTLYSYTDADTYSCADEDEPGLLNYCKQIYNKCGLGFCKI